MLAKVWSGALARRDLARSRRLCGLAIALIVGVMRLVNIAHGDLIVLAAYLGLTEDACKGLVERARHHDPGERFPAFWGPNFDWTPDQCHGNVAALAQISFVSFLLAPPLLGLAAEHLGIRWTFGLGLPLVLLSAALSSSLRAAPRRYSSV